MKNEICVKVTFTPEVRAYIDKCALNGNRQLSRAEYVLYAIFGELMDAPEGSHEEQTLAMAAQLLDEYEAEFHPIAEPPEGATWE